MKEKKTKTDWGAAQVGALVLLLAAAGFPKDAVREGNAAYADGDYAAAIEHYRRAEGPADDPGQVAFNLAAAHYQLGDFSVAARHYRQALEDAQGIRRVRSLYGLANSLVEQARSARKKAALVFLNDAESLYHECLKTKAGLPAEEQPNSNTVFDDAAFNLEIARRLLAETRAKPDEPDPPDQPQTPPEMDRPPPLDGGFEPGAEGIEGGPDDGQVPRASDQFRAGKGNLPPLLDDVNSPSLTAEEAAAYLQQNMARIRKDRASWNAPDAVRALKVRDW